MSNVVQLRKGTSIRDFKARLAKFPVSLAHEIAQQAAPLLTSYAQQAFDSGTNVYGEPRPEGKGGRKLTLYKTGDTRRAMRFVANGRIVRCSLGPRYARYLIGKYKILPVGDRTSMPASWQRALDELVRTVQVRPSLVAA